MKRMVLLLAALMVALPMFADGACFTTGQFTTRRTTIDGCEPCASGSMNCIETRAYPCVQGSSGNQSCEIFYVGGGNCYAPMCSHTGTVMPDGYALQYGDSHPHFSGGSCSEPDEHCERFPQAIGCPDGPPEGCPILIGDGDAADWKYATSWATQTLFDLNGDGAAEQTGWFNFNLGFSLLAIDINGDGQITSGLELFGDAAHSDGFARLAVEDTNGDGIVSALDARWSQLLLWDGDTLTSLASSGIVALELDAKERPRKMTHDGSGRLRFRGDLWRTNERGHVRREKFFDVYVPRY